MWFNLLEAAEDTSATTTNKWLMPVLMGLAAVAAIVFLFLNRRSQKKKANEMQGMLDAIQPGNKVKTIGGICGIVVEVCPEDNTFVLETGTEASGKSYIKFDKQAVYQTDATAPKKEVAKKPVKNEVVEAPVEEKVEETVEAPVAEETAPVAKKSKKKNKKK